jgi:hypothetical protein
MPPDASRSVHMAVVRLIEPILGPVPLHYGQGPDFEDPLSISLWAYVFNASWGILGAGVAVLMALGLLWPSLFGQAVANAYLSVVLGASFFCLAGSAAAIWGRYLYLPKAKRRSHRGDPEGFERNMHRALPTNRSLVFQAAVGLFTTIYAAATVSGGVL